MCCTHVHATHAYIRRARVTRGDGGVAMSSGDRAGRMTGKRENKFKKKNTYSNTIATRCCGRYCFDYTRLDYRLAPSPVRYDGRSFDVSSYEIPRRGRTRFRVGAAFFFFFSWDGVQGESKNKRPESKYGTKASCSRRFVLKGGEKINSSSTKRRDVTWISLYVIRRVCAAVRPGIARISYTHPARVRADTVPEALWRHVE